MTEELIQKSARTLEFHKVCERLGGCAVCAETAERVAAITPAGGIATAALLQKETADARDMIERHASPPISAVRDMRGAAGRAQKGASLSLFELMECARVLRCARELRAYGESAPQDGTLYPYFFALRPNRTLEERITNSILSEEEVADAASPELASIRRRIRGAQSRVREILQKMTASPTYQKYLQEPIVTIRSDRFVIPVRAEHKGDVPGLVHDTSQSGATLFVEPLSVVEQNNEIRTLQGKEKDEIARVIAELSALVAEADENISESYTSIIELDLMFARARLALDMRAVRPELSDGGVIDFRAARHPLIDPGAVVPIDIRLGGEFDTLVITGPNTGGKTVTLKTLGLLSLMAQAGLQLPVAEGSRAAVFTKVFADIGDEQSIEQSLSTFSSHMTNIVAILRSVDEGSLVLFDELGAGTDPVEGAALATAILESVRQSGARTAATTHYAELKAYALRTDGVENASCEFDVATLKPTYRLLIGVPGKSNAFAISERLGLPGDVVARAGQLIGEETRRFEDVLSRLDGTRQRMEQAQEQAALMESEARRLREQADAERRRMETERDRELERARAEARRIIASARHTAEAVIDELEAVKKVRDGEEFRERLMSSRRAASARLREEEDALDPVSARDVQPEYKLPRPLKAGDAVLIASLDKRAVVLSPPDGAGSVYVQAGIIKTRVALGDLRLIEEERPKPPQGGAVGAGLRGTASAATELDLRGQTSDEAIIELDRFLDQAAIAGVPTVTIIHGKGTGALRAAVQGFLRTHAHAAAFRLGTFGEGEAGVTIVDIK